MRIFAFTLGVIILVGISFLAGFEMRIGRERYQMILSRPVAFKIDRETGQTWAYPGPDQTWIPIKDYVAPKPRAVAANINPFNRFGDSGGARSAAAGIAPIRLNMSEPARKLSAQEFLDDESTAESQGGRKYDKRQLAEDLIDAMDIPPEEKEKMRTQIKDPNTSITQEDIDLIIARFNELKEAR